MTEAQIQERKTREYQEKEHDIAVARELVNITNGLFVCVLSKKIYTKFFLSIFFFQNQYEGNQWGRPGPGGPYWRERTLTGQGFFEKMVKKF